MKLKKQSFFSKLWNDNLYCFLAAIIAAVIMIFVYMCYNFFPVGDNIILRMDLYHQYAPLFAELYDRIFQGKTLLYSFTSGLGSGFLGNYFNYLASPTLLFVLIFGHANVPEAIAAMVLTKAAVSAFTFSYFTKKVFKDNTLISTVFGIMYAFSGWFVAYYWNVMWLDAVCIFPIVMLGIYKIITKCKPLTFIVSLAFVLVTNYYMGYMVCILSVIMFLYFYFSQYEAGDKINKDIILKKQYTNSVAPKFFNNRFLKSGSTFAVAGITAGAIAAFALIPVYFILQHSSATSSTFPESGETYFTIFDFLANHLSGLTTTIRSSGDDVLPNVYCGILTLVLLIPYFFTKEIKIREKIASVVTIAVFYFSFNLNYLNYIWHGFHFPNDLPYRFSFAYSFFLLIIAFRVISNIDKISLKTILGSSFSVLAFIVLVEEIGSKNAEDLTIWSAIAFTILYTIIIAFLKDKKYVKSYISILLLCTVCTEILIADTPNYVVSQDKTSYNSGYEQVEDCLDIINEAEGENTFYRTELASLVKRMDNSWYGYNGSSTFTSMAYEELSHLESKLGLSGNDINSYSYHSQTPVYNSLFNIKYIIDNTSYTNTDNYTVNYSSAYYEELQSVEDATIYKCNNVLPLAYSSNEDILEWNYEDTNPFNVQSNMFKAITGVDKIFNKVNMSVESSTNIVSLSDGIINNNSFVITKLDSSDSAELMLKIVPNGTENIYLYFSSDDVDSFYVTYNDNIFTTDIDEPFIIDCGETEKEEEIYVTIGLDSDTSSASVTGYAYSLNEENYKKGIDTVNKAGTLNITEYSENIIKGTITVAENDVIFTSIPYDASWTVKIDGETVTDDNILIIGNALLGVKTTAGEHEIEFSYFPQGLISGISISIFAVILLILVYVSKRKKILVFSDKFIADNTNLGKWRDFGAEEEAKTALFIENTVTKTENEENESDVSSILSSDEKITWEDVLTQAEDWAKKQEEDRRKEQEQLEAIQSFENSMGLTQSVNVPDSKTDENVQSDIETSFGTKFEDIPEEIIPQTEEQSTDTITNNIKTDFISDEQTVESKKKKPLNKKTAAIVFAIAIAVLLIVLITSLSGKNNNEPIFTTNEATQIADSTVTTTKKETTTVTTTKETTTVTTTKATTAKQTTAVVTTPPTTAKAQTTQGTTANGNYTKYTVQSGDYPFSILRKAGLEPNKYLQEFYDINGGKTSFNVGDTVLIPNAD